MGWHVWVAPTRMLQDAKIMPHGLQESPCRQQGSQDMDDLLPGSCGKHPLNCFRVMGTTAEVVGHSGGRNLIPQNPKNVCGGWRLNCWIGAKCPTIRAFMCTVQVIVGFPAARGGCCTKAGWLPRDATGVQCFVWTEAVHLSTVGGGMCSLFVFSGQS